MRLTFGKFRGWDTNEVALAGSIGTEYLEWCSMNLMNPKWRRECERALRANTGIDTELAIRALMEIEGYAYYDAAEVVACEIEEMDFLNEIDNEIDATIRKAAEKFAPIMGTTVEKLIQLAIHYVANWEDLSPKMFSSEEMYNNFQAFMQEAWP